MDSPYSATVAPFAPHVRYVEDALWIEGVPVAELAKRFGTPLFLYSNAAFVERAEAYLAAFDGLTVHHHVALKANDNLTLLSLLAKRGFGADAASFGEMHRAELAGFEPETVVFNGNGKGDADLIRAHRSGISLIIVDSLFELQPLAETADLTGRTTVPIALRVNPDIDPVTHPYLATGIQSSKFGFPPADLPAAIDFIRAHPSLRLCGIHCHLGSMIEESSPYDAAITYLLNQANTWREEGFPITELCLGGGFAVPYREGERFAIEDFAALLRARFGALDYTLHLEPGRYLFAEAGFLITSVRGVKQTPHKTFLVVDAGMGDNIRPALYHARHPVFPVVNTDEAATVDLVGPLCESGDFLALDVDLPLLARDELVVQACVGAYSYAMQMHYNGRLRPPECLVDGHGFELIRDREPVEDLDRRDLFFP
ncbi:MAG: diaminopimelate decarboxylase [bacterium]